MNHNSPRESPGGSTALLRNWSSRCVFVNVPAFSAVPAAGNKKISVPILSGGNSPLTASGDAYQNDAVSVSTISRTTSHFNFPSADLCSLPFDAPTAGFCPITNSPSILPSCMSSQYPSWNDLPSLAAASRIRNHCPQLLHHRNRP